MSVVRRRLTRKRQGYHHGDLKRVMIDAALLLIERRGPLGWTMREAARSAGVSPGAPYRHFDGKNALLAAVAEAGFRELRAALERACTRAGDVPIAQLAAIGIEHVRFATQHPSHYRVMFGPEALEKPAYPTLHRAAKSTFALLVEVIRRCQNAQLLRDGDPVEIAIAAFAIMHGLSELILTRQLKGMDYSSGRVDELPSRLGRLLFEGIAPNGMSIGARVPVVSTAPATSEAKPESKSRRMGRDLHRKT